MNGEDGGGTSEPTIRAVGMAGSLREGSYNRALLRTIVERVPDGLEIDVFDLAPVPFYNRDVEVEGDPEPVAALKAALHAADLVFIVTPEYNQGLPAVTKNALDWGSRPPKPQCWDGKPVAILGATPGRLGTVSAQRILRESLSANAARVMPQPRMLVAGAGDLFDDELRLTDEGTLSRLDKFVLEATEWARIFKRSRAP